jgi:hypothetical protein
MINHVVCSVYLHGAIGQCAQGLFFSTFKNLLYGSLVKLLGEWIGSNVNTKGHTLKSAYAYNSSLNIAKNWSIAFY